MMHQVSLCVYNNYSFVENKNFELCVVNNALVRYIAIFLLIMSIKKKQNMYHKDAHKLLNNECPTLLLYSIAPYSTSRCE
jgi:hypothetical protein